MYCSRVKAQLQDESRKRIADRRAAIALAHRSARKRGAPSKRSLERLERLAQKSKEPFDPMRLVKQHIANLNHIRSNQSRTEPIIDNNTDIDRVAAEFH